MTEDRIEELLYRILQRGSARGIATELGYNSATELVKALKAETVGADELLRLIEAADLNSDPKTRDWIFFNSTV